MTTPAGTSPTAGTGNDYTYDAVVPAPTVTALNPTHGAAAGGNTVTITGTDFTGATAVQFGANAATGVTVVNATTITATAPAGTAGTTVDVTVTTPAGTSPTAGTGNDYTYDAVVHGTDGDGAQPDPRRGRGRQHGDDHRHRLDRRDRGQVRRQRGDRVHGRQRDHDHGHRPGGHRRDTVDVTVTTPAGTSPTAGTGNDYTYDAVVRHRR